MSAPNVFFCATCATGAPLEISTGAANENKGLHDLHSDDRYNFAPLDFIKISSTMRRLRHWRATEISTGAANENKGLGFDACGLPGFGWKFGKIIEAKSLILLCATGGRRISYGNYTTGASLSIPTQVPLPVAVGAKAPLTRASTLTLVPRESKPLRRGSWEPQAVAQTYQVEQMEKQMDKNECGFGCELLVIVKFQDEKITRNFDSKNEMHDWLAKALQRDGSATYEVYEMLFSGGRT